MNAKQEQKKYKITTDDGDIVEAIQPVVISASRSTDIPAFYAEWFINRLLRGYVKWINPFNQKPLYVSFAKTRCIVFWSKNPKPLIPFLSELDARGINYYFQFTVNDYEREKLEPNVPPLSQRIETFRQLSERIGKKRVIWRFDPLILTEDLSVNQLLDKVSRVAEKIYPFTERLVFSFADISSYKKVCNTLKRENIQYKEFAPELMLKIAEGIHRLNKNWGLTITTCAETINLEAYGIERNRCIDDRLMIELFKHDFELMRFLKYEENLFSENSVPYLKDKGQREECGCIASKDIGMYNTCSHLCAYCYANTSQKTVEVNIKKHNYDSDSIINNIQ